MDSEIIVAVISGIFAFLGLWVTVKNENLKALRKIQEENEKTRLRLEQLEKKQDKHNSLIERTYKIEERLNVIDEKLKVANHRIADLEVLENPELAGKTTDGEHPEKGKVVIWQSAEKESTKHT